MKYPLMFFFVLLSSGAVAQGAQWTMSSGKLTFVATQQEAEFEGEFETFTADIQFDPADLESSRIVATIDLQSTNTQNAERDEYLFGSDFFFVDEFRQARYTANQIRKQEDGTYLAEGMLSLRGFEKAVPLAFEFDVNGARARFVGRGSVMRLDFGVGQGMWTDTTWIGNEVTVNVELELTTP